MQDASINGMKLLPADFLINEDGIIVDIFRADNNFSSRHMPFERIEACFIPESKRCKCYRKDCISPACRAHDNKRATLWFCGLSEVMLADSVVQIKWLHCVASLRWSSQKKSKIVRLILCLIFSTVVILQMIYWREIHTVHIIQPNPMN